MFKFSDKHREELAEIKHGWFALIIVAILASSQILIEHYFGCGWRIVAALLALPVWLIVRPWLFGLLCEDTRRRLKLQGLGFFVALVILAVISYYRH